VPFLSAWIQVWSAPCKCGINDTHEEWAQPLTRSGRIGIPYRACSPPSKRSKYLKTTGLKKGGGIKLRGSGDVRHSVHTCIHVQFTTKIISTNPMRFPMRTSFNFTGPPRPPRLFICRQLALGLSNLDRGKDQDCGRTARGCQPKGHLVLLSISYPLFAFRDG
jgi:hypothetical protein